MLMLRLTAVNAVLVQSLYWGTVTVRTGLASGFVTRPAIIIVPGRLEDWVVRVRRASLRFGDRGGPVTAW